MKWEYEIVRNYCEDLSELELKKWLNELGSHGWEAVQYKSETNELIIKRPVEINEKLRAKQLEEGKHDNRPGKATQKIPG